LVTLKLDENQLTTFPKTIGKLSNLEELILSQNDFETLPPCVGLLRKLNILNVDDNILEELPPGKAFLCPSFIWSPNKMWWATHIKKHILQFLLPR